MSKFLHDAKRFVFSFGTAADLAPLQLYSSALTFAPKASLVRQTFEAQIPKWISQLPLVECDWSACLYEVSAGIVSRGCVMFLPNGWVAVTSEQGVKILDPASRTYIHTFSDHKGDMDALALLQDGKLASASSDGTVKTWDPKNGECWETYLVPNAEQISCMAFSADGRYLSLVTKAQKCSLVESHTGKLVQSFDFRKSRKGRDTGHAISTEQFSRDGRWLALSRTKIIKLFDWELAKDTNPRYLTSPQRAISRMEFSADSKLLYSASYDNTVVMWDTATGQCLRTLQFPCAAMTALACSKDRVAVGTKGGNVVVLDLEEGAKPQSLAGHAEAVESLAFSPNGELLASSTTNNSTNIWDLTVKTSGTREGYIAPVREIAFASSFKLVVSSDLVHNVKVWDALHGTLKGQLAFNDLAAVATAEKAPLLGVGLTGKVQIIDLGSMCRIQTVETSLDHVRSLGFSTDGRRLAAALSSRGAVEARSAVQVWDLEHPDPRHVKTIPINDTKELGAVTLSPDGSRVLVVKQRTRVVVTNLETDDCWTGDFKYISTIDFSSDGRYIIAGYTNWAGKMWDSATGQCLWECPPQNHNLWPSRKFQTSFLMEIALHDLALSSPRGEACMQWYHLGHDGSWVVRDGLNMLLLRLESAVSCAATAGSTIAVGSRMGEVIIIGLG